MASAWLTEYLKRPCRLVYMDEEEPAIAATFLFQDRLTVSPTVGEGAYALFLLGTVGPQGYRRAFTWYHRAEDGGKGVPRYFNHLDWDGDGRSEVLLDVLGAERRWFAGLARSGAQWTRSFQDACGPGASAPAG